MRTLCLLLGMMLLPIALRAADVGTILKVETAKCAAAWQRSDYETILSYFPARVVQQLGGRAVVTRELKDQFAQARSLGVERLEVIPGKAPAPKQIGRLLTALIPVKAILHSAHLDLTQETHVLGLSSNKGKSWSFVLLYDVTQAELNRWFPELAGKVIVPSAPTPRLEVVY